MNNKEQHSYSSVISINPYSNSYINEKSGFLTSTLSSSYSKDQYVISYLNTKDFITSQISISKNIPDEDLYDAIFSKAYDELALDQAIHYQMQYIETFYTLDEESRNFHIFIIDPLITQDIFSKSIDKITYIDYIVPSPLLLKSLYTREIIQNNGVHCFIYFDKNDTFITIYSDKEFIYTKSINYSLIQIHDRFCELYGEKIEYDEFINFLSTQNLKNSTSDYKEYVLKLYKEIFANINDVLTYVKRVLEIQRVDNIYIGSGLHTATKLHEISELELGIKSSEFNFDYGYENTNTYVDQLHSLMHVYASTSEDERYETNFTTYERPPKFIKRQSGKIILLTAASFIIAFIYPVSYWTLSSTQGSQYKSLQKEFQEKHNQKITREATINKKLVLKKKLTNLLEEEKKNYLEKKNTLIKIHDVKVNYPMKADLLYRLTKDLNTNDVEIESLSYSQDTQKILTLNLVSSKDQKITDLLKFLTKKYQNKFHFSLTKISFEDDSKKYFSELKVSL